MVCTGGVTVGMCPYVPLVTIDIVGYWLTVYCLGFVSMWILSLSSFFIMCLLYSDGSLILLPFYLIVSLCSKFMSPYGCIR